MTSSVVTGIIGIQTTEINGIFWPKINWIKDNHTPLTGPHFCARDRQVFFRRRAFIFRFFQSCTLPASSDEVFLNLSSFPCVYFHSRNCSYKIKAVKFPFSRTESNFFSKANEIRTLLFSLTHVRQINSLRRPQ